MDLLPLTALWDRLAYVRHRTDCTGYCDQTALGVLTRRAAVFVRSDRAEVAEVIDRAEWVEGLPWAAPHRNANNQP